MKEYCTITTIPVTVSKDSEEENKECVKQLNQAISNGFEVKHITSAVVCGEMYVYHFLEREAK